MEEVLQCTYASVSKYCNCKASILNSKPLNQMEFCNTKSAIKIQIFLRT